MAGGGCAWSRRVAARMRTLRGLVRDTQRALSDVVDILNTDPDILVKVQDIGSMSSRPTALVILGTSPDARARLLHALLGRELIPVPAPSCCRWIRIQFGSSTQVHLTLGNSEFELVDELECSRSKWDTIPHRDLLRQDPHDLSTMLEIELNNAFLKDGLKIIVPPDLPSDPGSNSYLTLKEKFTDLYKKRGCFLRNYNQVYLYAIDRTGKNIFNENISSSGTPSRSEEDFWSTFNLYHMAKGDSSSSEGVDVNTEGRAMKDCAGPAVFAAENCLDLHQVKEIDPNSQLLFVLFSDSPSGGEDKEERSEATESTEDYSTEHLPESDQELVKDIKWKNTTSPIQNKPDKRRVVEEHTAFMNELLDRWELMTTPPPKHYIKSQWTIIDDAELCTPEVKPLSGLITSAIQTANEKLTKGCVEDDAVLKSRTTFLSKVVKFATESVHSQLLDLCTKLSEVHIKLLQQFILASFDLARELQVVPKKIQYVALKEQELYRSINQKFSSGDKKQELVQMMQEVLLEMRADVHNMDWSVDDLPCHQDQRFLVSNSVFYSSSQSTARTESIPLLTTEPLPSMETASDGEEAESYDSYNFDDFEIIHSNEESLSEFCRSRSEPQQEDTTSIISQVDRIPIESESLMFSVSGLRWMTSINSAATCTSGVSMSVKQASLDVQHTVLSKLSRKISAKLVKFVDCLKEAYFGTLHRCLESLEWSCRQELGGRPATTAMRHLAAVARQVDLTPCASFSVLRSMLESIRRLFSRLRVSGGGEGGACCVLSPAWRRQVAVHTLRELSAPSLARVISVQILERLNTAHERYQSALGTLESALAGRLHHTEDIKLAIRKKYAPSFARLCLESTSMCDLLMYGTPELGREIGRGQYGVVYSVRGSWAGKSPLAVKSVLPADERHYHELAMEFFYTRSIPAHPRIVRLFGSIVQRYGAGPTVLLVSDRKCRDLHTAVRAGLPLATRLRISIDIVEGIRYLHSLGLVHRDIKMKNVLLDAENRASLSDLGFCAAEALISGSVVGTPVHMAPELLAGEYDATVDVYAFGILFWYVCAGNVKLPTAFETFQNKEQLWSKVRRGLRPERLSHFSDACWEVMQSCWASEPSERALLGDVQPQLEAILEEVLISHQEGGREGYAEGSDTDDDDSLDMTGIGLRDDIM